MKREHLTLYLVMGSNQCQLPPEQVLREAIAGGITLFQFREKGEGALRGHEKYRLAEQLFTICRENKVPFIVNDDVELMLALDADGIHIGQEDAPIEEVRLRIGKKILGVSAHTLFEAQDAYAKGADYLGVGPMYETRTKPDIREVKGPEVIAEMRKNGIHCPLVGIGGITLGRVTPVITAGADGVAVITAITQSADPRKAAALLKQEVHNQ